MRSLRYCTFVKQASLIKTRLTSLEQQIYAYSGKTADALSETDLARIKTIDETAVKKSSDFDSLVNKLYGSDTPDEDIKDTDVVNFQEEISDLYIKIHSICVALVPATDARLDQSHSSVNTSITEATGIKLPTLQLGEFSGQADKWIAFYSLFDSTVNKNSKLSDVEKFTYLLSCLHGEPLSLIKSLPITAANYHIGYRLLIKRYNNSRLLITLHINNIIDLPSVHNFSVKQMRFFVSALQENMSALRALQHELEEESIFMTTYLLRKFDNDFRSKFEHNRADSQKLPTIKELIDFIETQCSQLEAAHLSLSTPRVSTNATTHKGSYNSATSRSTRGSSHQRTALMTTIQNNCKFCSSSNHAIYKCIGFSNISPAERLKFVQTNSMCHNCLGRHNVRNCNSSRSCNVCQRRHHTMLHLYDKGNTPSSNAHNNSKQYHSRNSSHNQATEVTKLPSFSCNAHSEPSQSNTSATKDSSSNATALVGLSHCSKNVVLLGTALVNVNTTNGNSIVARAVLDSAAQQSFISESCIRRLGISQVKSSGHKILGISSTSVTTKGLCYLNITSIQGHIVAKNHPVVVLDNITANLPGCLISREVKARTFNLVLADPAFDKPAPVDLLIGADLFANTLNGDAISLGEDMPTALNTVFGYVLMGNTPIETGIHTSPVNLLTITNTDLHQSIQQFWNLENVPNAPSLSPDELCCEKHFKETHSRCKDGRYQVRLPFKQSPTCLGNSSASALCIFKSLEKRLNRNPEIKKKYVDFMKEYEASGHMVACSSLLPPGKPLYFLPHHEVLREDKIRVVFNASATTVSGLSLNNILHSGPKLHNDIPAIIMGFRQHRIVFTCDIRQMFRNIWVHPDEHDFQRIYWRSDESQPIQVYKLNTVTYGMASSPFLANRVVQQLIEDESQNHPLAAKALRGQIYVDDALLGANTEEEALLLQEDVIRLMAKGGFSLRKWVSNHQNILKPIPSDYQAAPLHFSSNEEVSCNVLGMKWLPENDSFSYSVAIPSLPPTKRSVLSAIAQLFDPMGWITPAVFWAKAFMQVLWTKGLQWDDPLPAELSSQWSLFLKELPLLSDLRIPRHVDTHHARNIQLHGFCDASESGYCASVMLRVQTDDDITSHLLMAKSRVAPLKRLSLPRLELCGAHLLAKTIQYCVDQLSTYLSVNEIFAWCDSTITLSWIHTPAYRLKTFVANRVAEIQETSIPILWSHIISEQNPADCGSRGLLPSRLIDHPLWWKGPDWIQRSQLHWPTSSFKATSQDLVPEMKLTQPTALKITTVPSVEILTRFSSWIKLRHVTAYVLRFINCCRNQVYLLESKMEQSLQEDSSLSSSRLSLQEINHATVKILRLVQQESFSTDISALQKGHTVSVPLQRLSPFLDKDGLLRVGGRLVNASLNYNSKHPILLPKHHFITNLIIDYYHNIFLHCGPQLLQSLISQRYWILSARSKIRNRIFQCLRCYRLKPKLHAPMMADLPASRVLPSRVFETSAVDFAGPFNVKLYPLRRLQHVKVYLCLFICMTTKAIHLEVVTDLTADAFLASLTRFISRRGLVKHLHCDNATNFVGAARKLHRTVETILKQEHVNTWLLDKEITFHFIPPRTPHFGGLWERAVQSAKFHMRRVIGDQILTLEEFSTLTCRVEAMLNSRPITPLSSDPCELEALTPGHFLTFGPPALLPQNDHSETPMSRLKRWQLVQSFTQNIWKRWKQDYLHTLQNRPKWTKCQRHIEPGDLVILREDNVPPLQWKTGRVTNLLPGKDNVPRVAEVKTATGLFKRPVIKLSLLPSE